MLQQKLAAIANKRATSRPLPSGLSPVTSSNDFRVNSYDHLGLAKSSTHRFSIECQSQQISPLAAAAATMGTLPPSVISLANGRPSPQYLPWESIEARGSAPIGQTEDSAFVTSSSKSEQEYSLSAALSYGYAAGSPQLLRFITEHIEMIHSPRYQDWETCLTCGTTSAIDIVLRMFCNRGDTVLAEMYTFPGFTTAARSQGLKLLGVKMDDFGLLPEDLDSKLQAWDPAKGPKPFLLYMIPSGQNPTGTSQAAERRQAIYRVAEKHDLYIIEDDPYYFLQLGSAATDVDPATSESGQTPADRYIARLPPSYLSLDTSGRVVRLESTAKLLGPGLRCGWLTACSQVVQKFLKYTEISTQAPSGLSQVMVYKLLDETWGHEGFINWLRHLSAQYSRRRDLLVRACERHLPAEVCHWKVPDTGMFLWVGLDLRKHPEFEARGTGQDKLCSEVEDRVYARALANGVLVSKGSWFNTGNSAPTELCFRMTFAVAPEDAIDQAAESFGKAVRAEFAPIRQSCEGRHQNQTETDDQRDWSKIRLQSPGTPGNPTQPRESHCRQPGHVTASLLRSDLLGSGGIRQTRFARGGSE